MREGGNGLRVNPGEGGGREGHDRGREGTTWGTSRRRLNAAKCAERSRRDSKRPLGLAV